MKQVLQSMRDGKTIVADVPTPAVRSGAALVRTAVSLVSAGTERMLVDFASKSLVGKAQARPDLVNQLLDKARREGLLPTIEAAFNRLDQPMSLGYSSAGTVIALGAGMEGFQIGDRVACAGGGFAVHAEYAVVPKNLLVRLPPQVDFESAAFTTLGAIAMHGFRLAQPQLGERVAIIGLGLLGMLAAQIARAAGCNVFGIDLNPQRIALARQLGFEASPRTGAEEAVPALTRGMGFDLVLICADSTSHDPVELAGAICRDRGRVIAIGAVGLEIPRKIYYDKEIHFQVSRSYGPGRYDSSYEEGGRDYPAGYVRWTEGRNLENFVDLIASEKISLAPLVSHRFSIEHAPQAYDVITGKEKQPFLGVLLTYPKSPVQQPGSLITLKSAPAQAPEKVLSVGVLGAGNYASAVFLPAIRRVGGVDLAGIASASGISARHAAQKFGFRYAASSEEALLTDPSVNIVVVLTRHNHHVRQVCGALRAGKHTYCEKPLALDTAGLEEIAVELARPGSPLLTVGFNRRFAPLAIELHNFFVNRHEPLAIHYRVNAGFLPANHWLHDPAQGGGRIIGEGCHFIDFLTYLIGEPPISVSARALPDGGKYRQDNVFLSFVYPDGSVGNLTYLANGDKSLPKERIEAFCGGRVGILDDFRTLDLVADGHHTVKRSILRQDKGHASSWSTFITAVKNGGDPPISYRQIWGTSLASFAAIEALSSGKETIVPRVQMNQETDSSE